MKKCKFNFEIWSLTKYLLRSQFEEQSRFLVDYEPISLLGSGAYGVVIEANSKIDQTSVAVKITRVENELREIKLLAELAHKNIVQYKFAWIEEKEKGNSFCFILF